MRRTGMGFKAITFLGIGFLLLFDTRSLFALPKLEGSVLDISPWAFNTPKRVDGLHPRLLNELEKATDMQFTFALKPLNRVLWEMSHSATDFSILVLRENMEKTYESLGVVEDLSQYLLTSKEDHDVERVGILRGDLELFKGSIKKRFGKAKLQRVSHFSHLFRMFEAKRLDAVLYSGLVFEQYMQDEKKSSANWPEPQIVHVKKVHFLGKKSPPKGYSKSQWLKAKNSIRSAIAKFDTQGVLKNIGDSVNRVLLKKK